MAYSHFFEIPSSHPQSQRCVIKKSCFTNRRPESRDEILVAQTPPRPYVLFLHVSRLCPYLATSAINFPSRASR